MSQVGFRRQMQLGNYYPRVRGSYVGAAVGALGQYLGNKRRRMSQNGGSNNKREFMSSISTFQSDKSRLYRKGRVNKRKLRRYKRFARGVNRVLNNSLALKSLTRIISGNFTSGFDAVGWYSFMLGATNGVDDVTANLGSEGNTDLNNVISAFEGSTIISPGTQFSCIVNKMIGNLTIKSNVTVEVGTLVYLTVYYISARKDVPASDSNPTAVFQSGLSQNVTFPLAGSIPLTPSDKTVTPFISAEFCEHFVITKIVRVTLSPGQETQLQIRSRRPFKLNNAQVQDTEAIAGKTLGLMCSVSGSLNGNGQRNSVSTSYEWVRSYLGKDIDSSINAAGRI